MPVLLCNTTDKMNVTFPEAIYATFATRVSTVQDTRQLIIVNNDNGEPVPDIDELVAMDPGVTKRSTESYLGLGAARQFALEAASEMGCEYLLLMDDDVIAPADVDWVTPFIEPFSDADMFGTGPFPAVVSDNFDDPAYTRNANGAMFLDTPYAIRVGMALELGGYDDFWITCADNADLMFRALLAGKKLKGIANPGLLHYHQMTLGSPDYHYADRMGELRDREHKELRTRFAGDLHAQFGHRLVASHMASRSDFVIDVPRGRGKV